MISDSLVSLQKKNYRALLFIIVVSLIITTPRVDSFAVGNTLLTSKSSYSLGCNIPAPITNAASASSKYQSSRRETLKAVWRDTSVSLKIPASKDRTYALFSSLDEHPTW
jgi:hypothetical protein